MMVAIGDTLRNIANSDDGNDGEDEDDGKTEQGQFSDDDKPGWVICTIPQTVGQHMSRFRQEQIKLDQLTTLRWEDSDGNFRE
jgi:hypothetical protein